MLNTNDDKKAKQILGIMDYQIDIKRTYKVGTKDYIKHKNPTNK